jgi:hypothetical protein
MTTHRICAYLGYAALASLYLCIAASSSQADAFASNWHRCFNRIWIGESFWANPLEDWRIQSGRAVCTSRGGDRNLHVLTHQLNSAEADFELTVTVGLVEQGQHVGVGFRVGIHDEINDYRGNCIWGRGVDAGIVDGKLVVGSQSRPLPEQSLTEDFVLQLSGSSRSDGYRLNLKVIDAQTRKQLAELESEPLSAKSLVGNVAIVSNLRLPTNQQRGSTYSFADFRGTGDKLTGNSAQQFGPILWSMYSVSDSRTDAGYVLKLTAFLPPISSDATDRVALKLTLDDGESIEQAAAIDPATRTAEFRIENWQAQQAARYCLTYDQKFIDGNSEPATFEGIVRAEPADRPLVLGGLTCQHHSGFPYGPVAENLKKLDPDLLFFSGDQLYEENGHYGIERRDVDRAILNYLRKFYMFGWVFGDVMRDRPTLCIPDDHDVFHGNIWGEGGEGAGTLNSGYAQPVDMVQVVHRTNCSHHPDFFDATPAGRGISVYYGDMVWGRTSFAILGDRQFKSSPERVSTGKGRPDHVADPDFDVAKLDHPDLVLLGDRQEDFLETWVKDWRKADMKLVLSETVFANVATHHGARDGYLRADLDSGGWPQTARNRALRIIRRGLPLHVNGDQHLSTLVQYGIDTPRDGSWSFCTPAISVGYPRWWRPEDLGQVPTERPPHARPNTGQFRDGFNHPTYVYAVGNPAAQTGADRYQRAHNKASGFGIIRVDHESRTFTCEAYRFCCDASRGPTPDNQFPGWPHTIAQRDNDGRSVAGYLSPIDLSPFTHPVVSVYSAESDELLYCFPPQGDEFKPWVFAAGSYRVAIVDDNGNTTERVETFKLKP